MNFRLDQLPDRAQKPREKGLTMVMDKGLSIRQAQDFIEVSSEYIDVIKLGFATSIFTPNLENKLQVYRDAEIPFYFGGTLFEAFVARGQFDDYRRYLDKYKVPMVEVSDGCLNIAHEDKLEFISTLAKDFRVLSEVGSKDTDKVIPPYVWVQKMKDELNAGSEKVIAEARESGTVGVFQSSGKARRGLFEEIVHNISSENIIWEAPQKSQQVWFIQQLGPNVNLGNIAPTEVIPMETLRWGLRGDTFFTFLEEGKIQFNG